MDAKSKQNTARKNQKQVFKPGVDKFKVRALAQEIISISNKLDKDLNAFDNVQRLEQIDNVSHSQKSNADQSQRQQKPVLVVSARIDKNFEKTEENPGMQQQKDQHDQNVQLQELQNSVQSILEEIDEKSHDKI